MEINDSIAYRNCIGDLTNRTKAGAVYTEEVCRAFVLEKRMSIDYELYQEWDGQLHLYV